MGGSLSNAESFKCLLNRIRNGLLRQRRTVDSQLGKPLLESSYSNISRAGLWQPDKRRDGRDTWLCPLSTVPQPSLSNAFHAALSSEQTLKVNTGATRCKLFRLWVKNNIGGGGLSLPGRWTHKRFTPQTLCYSTDLRCEPRPMLRDFRENWLFFFNTFFLKTQDLRS